MFLKLDFALLFRGARTSHQQNQYLMAITTPSFRLLGVQTLCVLKSAILTLQPRGSRAAISLYEGTMVSRPEACPERAWSVLYLDGYYLGPRRHCAYLWLYVLNLAQGNGQSLEKSLNSHQHL